MRLELPPESEEPEELASPPRRSRLGLAFGALLTLAAVGALAFTLRGHQNQRAQAVPSASTPIPALRAPSQETIAESLFDGKLNPGWEDWGWGQHEYDPHAPARIRFSEFGGLILRHDEIAQSYGALVFRYRAPKSFGLFLAVSLKNTRFDEKTLPRVAVSDKHLADLGDGWLEAMIPWSELNPSALPFDRVAIVARRPVASEWVLLDKIGLTLASSDRPMRRGPIPVKNSQLSVDCNLPTVAISPYIYGIAQGAWTTGETGHRIGGNPMSRHNWELGTWNTGSDWYFENTKGDTSLWQWLDSTYSRGVKTALVVPMLGWVAKDATSYSFPISKFGAQQKHDPHKPDAGNGVKPDGSPLRPGPPSATSIPAPPELIRRWLTVLRDKDRERGGRSVDMYILDNEPNLWHRTHHDVHPEPLGYDELMERTIAYAKVIREVDPDAVIAGPAEWGWSAYFTSAKDLETGWLFSQDKKAHGDVPLLQWYLQQLSDYEKRTKTRLLDVLDVHFYPQAQGVHGEDERTDAATSALRLRSTRAFWDPSYFDESWIRDRVQLIPRLKEWIAKNYPGREISIGEWSFGAEKHISGALAIAETLGRFGQQGIRYAFYWARPEPGTPAFHGFRAFRNFDGHGSRFLDTSIPTHGTESVSLFASRDESGEHLVLLALNLDANFGARIKIDLRTCGTVGDYRTFNYSGGPDGLSEQAKNAKVAGGTFETTLEPYSINVFDLKVAASRKR